MAGLPASASWSGVTSGSTGTAVFHFTPTTGDAGSNYVVASASIPRAAIRFRIHSPFMCRRPTSSKSPSASSWPIRLRILGRRTSTRCSAPRHGGHFHQRRIHRNRQPCRRTNISVGWGIYNGSGTKVEDFSLNGPTLASSNCVVVYGSDAGEAPSLPAPIPVTTNTPRPRLDALHQRKHNHLRDQNGIYR